MTSRRTEQSTMAIAALVDREVQAVARGDIETYETLLSDDAEFMPPNGPARRGAELRTWLRQFLEEFAVEWLSFEHLEIVAEGDLGYHVYTYDWRVTPRADGVAILGRGKGIHILRRDRTGTWKIVREIWNATPVESG